MEQYRPRPDEQPVNHNPDEEKRLREQSVAQAYLAYLLNTPEESFTDIVLEEKSVERPKAESHVVFKTESPIQLNSITDISKRLSESFGLKARQEADGVYVSGSGKTAREILSFLGETRDIFEIFNEIEKKPKRRR